MAFSDFSIKKLSEWLSNCFVNVPNFLLPKCVAFNNATSNIKSHKFCCSLKCSGNDHNHFSLYTSIFITNIFGFIFIMRGLREGHMARNCKQPLIVELSSWLTASKKMGTSVLTPQGTNFCQQSHELRRGLQAPERNTAWPTSWLQLCGILSRWPS